ncbi:MAG: hypothetical protein CMJ88_01920 [Planctomycetes bacterium]|nr:hypothetical protein [Planctomycetota bacterium]
MHAHELCEGASAGLAHDVRAVHFDGLVAEPEARGYFLVGCAANDLLHDLVFPRAQCAEAITEVLRVLRLAAPAHVEVHGATQGLRDLADVERLLHEVNAPEL